MALTVRCGNGHTLAVGDDLAGRRVRCPKCREVVDVPAGATPAQPTPPAGIAPGHGPKPARGRGWKLPALLGGGLVALAGSALLVYWVVWGRGGKLDPARDREAARAVAVQFAEAVRGDDESGRKALLTEKARAELRKDKGWKQGAARKRPGATFEVGDARVSGDTAEVPVAFREAGKEERLFLKLRREGKEWRVYGLGVEAVPGDRESRLTVNLEDPRELAEQFFGKPGECAKKLEDELNRGMEEVFLPTARPEDRANETLASVDRAAFEQAWKHDLDVKGRPALEVLREQAKALDVKLETTPAQERALARPLRLRLRGRCRQELFEEVCRRTGFYPEYREVWGGPQKREVSVRLRQLPRALPVTFAGPFRVEVREVNEYVPHAAGRVELKVSATGLPPAVAQLLERSTGAVAVGEVTDARGRTLHDPTLRGNAAWLNRASEGYERVVHVGLKGLLRDVTRVQTLRGRVRVPLPGKVETLVFEKPAEGAVRRAGKVEVRLADVKRGEMTFNNKKFPRYTFTVSSRGVGPDRLRVLAYDAKKKLMHCSSVFSGGSDEGGSASYTANGEPDSLAVKVLAGKESAEYEFRLGGIALAEAGRMPEKQVPAKFPGHDAPVTLEFVGLSTDRFGGNVRVRVVNHSDKAIRALNMHMDYLAADGGRVGGWDHVEHHAVARPDQKDMPLVVGKGGTAVVEVHAPFLPGGTKKVLLRPNKVTFADATEWEAKPAGK